MTFADVDGLRADDAVEALLLEAVGDPIGYPTERDSGREQLRRQVQAMQQERGVELDVVLQVATGFVFFEEA